jgi:hypothetical protein
MRNRVKGRLGQKVSPSNPSGPGTSIKHFSSYTSGFNK